MPSGQTLQVPKGWLLLPPGDAALTRRVKAAGEHWLVQEKVGRKIFSRGVWAPRETIEKVQRELAAERSTDAYSRRREADSKRREAQQAEYVEDFQAAVLAFLAFHGRHAELAQRLAKAVTEHATPDGSGTVAPKTFEMETLGERTHQTDPIHGHLQVRGRHPCALLCGRRKTTPGRFFSPEAQRPAARDAQAGEGAC